MIRPSGALLVLLAELIVAGGSAALRAEEPATALFRQRVEPLLRAKCYDCHSHAAGEMASGLTLDWRSGWERGGERGPAIVPGKPERSLLIRAVRREDVDLAMPPDEPLSDKEVDVLVQWIKQGAFDHRSARPAEPRENPAGDWWSRQPLARPPVPVSRERADDASHPVAHPIDAFIQDALRREGLSASPEADGRTLIRRVMYDLVGLPPTPAEVRAFVADTHPLAYERLVDRLLASPRYGERWARHWLDTIHFADSHGFEHDVGREHAWRFRDYVIEAFNGDTPWPRFIREQLAADVFHPDQPQLTAALGFLGAGTFDLSAFSTAPVTFEYIDRDDLVTQTMAAFASTTANCARCHAHKFDPITQEDYYALQAVFAGVTKGNVAFDLDPEVARRRDQLRSLRAAADRLDRRVLLAPENAEMLAAEVRRIEQSARWVPLKTGEVRSAEGSSIQPIEDDVWLAGGTRPDKDTYTLAGTASLPRLTAVRLEVLPHSSLPQSGPGRQDNGNLHLSEFELRLVPAEGEEPRRLSFRSATADFNQDGWGIDRAIDGNPVTAWGIFPEVGRPHQAVFELTEPVALEAGAKLTVVMKQLHGGGHLIGAFRLSATADDPARAIAVPGEVAKTLGKPAAERTESERVALAAYALRRAAGAALERLPERAMVYAAARSVEIPKGNGQFQARTLDKPHDVHVLRRGDFQKPLRVAPPGALSMLNHLPPRFELSDPRDEAARRAALADWLAHRDNVLVWRSVVNRVWQYHFGRGLCDTPNDFGRMGGEVSHPNLLDWLAVWFRDDARGSLKALHRLIVTSAAYRQSSAPRPRAAETDGDNRLLWRQQRRRLDAGAVRDFTRAASGSLDLAMGGPGAQHFHQRPGRQVTPVLDYEAYDWSRPEARRRSIYRFVWRGISDPFMEALDFPDLGLLAPRRGFSVSPLQALTLLNNDFVLHHAKVMSERVEREADNVDGQVRRSVELAWCREPTAKEQVLFREFAERRGLAALCRVLLNSNEFLFVD